MIARKPYIRELIYNELLWKILLSKQNSGVSEVSRDLRSLILLQYVALRF